tara:strand:+ start:973 stop:1560 length:588 start_codon:yes stop_codon:yes gene_type:complete
MNILIIGNCGVGKTYIMTELLKHFKCEQSKQVEQVHYNTNDSKVLYKYMNEPKPETRHLRNQINIIGKYDGSTFQGSDRLSMSVMTSVDKYLATEQGVNIFEGDRFTNGKFIAKAKPYIIKILGNGKEGREKRGSQQTDRQIKSISTRVSNIEADAEVDSSELVLIALKKILTHDIKKELTKFTDVWKPQQLNLF